MSTYDKERLSALIDGEEDIHNDKLLENLIHDQAMQDTWSRYHLIGDCLRDNLPETISGQMASRVSDKLRDEPTVLAPQLAKTFNFKPLAGFAIAASVAMVAVLTVQNNSNTENSVAPSAPAIAANTIEQNQTQSFAFPNAPVLPASIKKSDAPTQMANQRLNNYLMNHNEYRSNGSMNGILPYVRLVTIESQEQ